MAKSKADVMQAIAEERAEVLGAIQKAKEEGGDLTDVYDAVKGIYDAAPPVVEDEPVEDTSTGSTPDIGVSNPDTGVSDIGIVEPSTESEGETPEG